MTNTGTSMLWSSASRDLPEARERSTAVWPYYASISIASPHGRIDCGGVLPPPTSPDVDQPASRREPLGQTAALPTGRGAFGSESREWGPWSLTHRELEVLQLLAEGATNGEISQRLFISPKTAKNHLAAIFQKLDVTNRTHALVRAVVMGLVNIE
jgi:DNA-binding CsgD family transcriptional regulator